MMGNLNGYLARTVIQKLMDLLNDVVITVMRSDVLGNWANFLQFISSSFLKIGFSVSLGGHQGEDFHIETINFLLLALGLLGI